MSVKLIKVKKADSPESRKRAEKIVKDVKSGSGYTVGPFRMFFKNGRISVTAPGRAASVLSDNDALELVNSAIMAKRAIMKNY